MGASQRTKGHTWERDVARRFRERLGLSAEVVKRGLSQPRGGTGEEPDVILPDDLPWWVECKVGARVNPVAALKQARDGIGQTKGSNKRPLAICKPDRQTPIAVVEFDDFLELLARVQDQGRTIDELHQDRAESLRLIRQLQAELNRAGAP